MIPMTWQLPTHPLRSRVLAAVTLGLASTLAAATLVMRAMTLTSAYPAKAMLVFAGVAAIVVGRLHAHHPFDRFGFANHVTTARVTLVALVAAFIGEASTAGAAAMAAVGGALSTALDGVDGWLARRSGTASAFGARYDMEVDALLIMVLAVLAWQLEKAGVWILLAGLMRYLFLAAGFAWQWMDAPLPPSVRRKLVCVVQIVGLAVVVSPFVSGRTSMVLAAGTLATLSYSFLVDVLWLRRHGA